MKKFQVSAPTRADLAGGTLDLWPLYCLTEGASTINVALPLRANAVFEAAQSSRWEVTLKSPAGDTLSFHKPLQKKELDALPKTLQFPAYLIHYYLSQQNNLPSAKVHISWTTEVPLGSGLGGSSTLAVTLARGISYLLNQWTEQGWQWKLLEWVRDVEASFLQTSTGTQDYLAALFGGLNRFISDVGGIKKEEYQADVHEKLNQKLLIIFSGEQHHSGLSNWELMKKALDKDARTLEGLHNLSRIAENMNQELRSSNQTWKEVGRLMNEDWKIRKEIFQWNTPKLDSLMNTLHSMKILGARVCGAAQGGSILVLCPPDSREEIKNRLLQEKIHVLTQDTTTQGVIVS